MIQVPDEPSTTTLKRVVALCFVAATLPLGIGVGILLAPIDRPPLLVLLASWAVVALVLVAAVLLLRRRSTVRRRYDDAALENLVFGLLGNMSHELRTPLNSIIGFSELLLGETERTLDIRHRQYLADVLGSGQQLLALVNDLLDLSKVTSGAKPLEREELVPADLVAEAFELVEPEAGTREVSLVAVDLSTRSVWGDRATLRKALVHLLDNALRFSPAGARVEVETRDVGGGVGFSVRDHGPLRDQALAAGTGLGLVISKRLIEEHGGFLALEPAAAGEGTTFRFRLPAVSRRPGQFLPQRGTAT